ncbi:MAG: hypothetical protein NO515_05205 [Candidatus Methanomethylicia archaeon]|jgi:hypothetical protein|uniref:Uncharacterized protein n=1 Tax=Thermoproteota archaeon TaxID=2056631 RepID=A0A523BG46_9CREN|nr:hypothetical protein [Candidatus Methanomethylicia archaeon]MCQ5374403.1 hypothetical protein [Candidatus Methanomethylicia archaeon]TDA39822.1 MAG: hypothetical protein DSO08_01230 [Candidatus Verstraetearchaeota archaeon]
MSGKVSERPTVAPQPIYRKMYYIRVVFAFLAGLICGALNVVGVLGLAIGIGVFILTYLLFRYGIKSISESVKDPKKFYMTGIFSYFLIWFVIWVVFFDILWMS